MIENFFDNIDHLIQKDIFVWDKGERRDCDGGEKTDRKGKEKL